ncbi:MAG: RHS repeat domain-containing protein [Lachnospirales bacterium]
MVFKNIRNSKRYDGMNRLSKEYTTTNNKEKVKAQYTYGKTGGVTLVTNDTSAIANKYDNKGLVMEQKLFEDGKSYAMVYGNNANGKCVYSKIYNNNTGHYGDYDIQQMINYEYDAKGNMTTVSDSLNNSKVMARYTYDSNDNLSSVTYGNGTSTSYTYNKGNMIEKVINNNADNTQMSIYSYDYYLDGNVSQQNRNGVKCYYDYDEFSRIIDEDYDREEIDYFYDAAGNRTLKKICDDNGDTDVNYTYDLNNRLLEESTNYYSKNEIDVTKYVYDNNGNQIKKIGYITKGVNGSPSQDLVSENELNNTYEIYKYNEFNEMTSFESNKESKWEYAYLPNGLRYRKSNASNFDRYVWDRNGNIIAEMNGEGNLTNKYVRGNKLISKNGNEYFGYDGHGSVVNISNESGKSIKSYDYDAFGVELNRDVNDTNLFRYCGEQYDNETDSIYLRARYYNPSLGRFTTEDTYWNSSNRIYGDKEYKEGEIKYPDYKAIIQSENLYIYCINNPTCYLDITGLNPEKKYIDSRNKSETYYTYYDKDDDTIYKPSFNTTTTLMIPTDDKSAAEATDYVLACYESTKLGEKIVGEIISGKIVGILSEEIPTIDIFAALDQSHESTVLVDDAGRYFNVEIGDKVYVTTASWSYKGICYTARAVEYRVKIIRNGEVMYNNTYFESM